MIGSRSSLKPVALVGIFHFAWRSAICFDVGSRSVSHADTNFSQSPDLTLHGAFFVISSMSHLLYFFMNSIIPSLTTFFFVHRFDRTEMSSLYTPLITSIH